MADELGALLERLYGSQTVPPAGVGDDALGRMLGTDWVTGPNRFAPPAREPNYVENIHGTPWPITTSQQEMRWGLASPPLPERVGDTTGFTPGANPQMAQLAGVFGHELGQGNWGPAALAAAGIATGVTQPGRPGGARGKPLPENVGIPRAERPGVAERAPKPEPPPKRLDDLGFYSALEHAAAGMPDVGALKDKPNRSQGWTPERWRKQLMMQPNVTQAEWQAMGIDDFMKGKDYISTADMLNHIRENRVQLKEAVYGGEKKETEWGMRPRFLSDGQPTKDWEVYNLKTGERQNLPMGHFGSKDYVEGAVKTMNSNPDIRWKRAGGQNLLLDPENPTNRESVVHAPTSSQLYEAFSTELRKKYGLPEKGSPGWANVPLTPAERMKMDRLAERSIEETDTPGALYTEAHFPNVPNYLAHLRTGKYKDAQGREWLLGDEAQSTRAQAIRDSKAGPRDEAKIGELLKRWNDADTAKEAALDAGAQWAGQHGADANALGGRRAALVQIQRNSLDPALRQQAAEHIVTIDNAVNSWNLSHAELDAARQAPSGHPLVNDMDLTNRLMMKRLIQQGVESGVEGITLTPGDLQNQRYNLSKHVNGLAYDPVGQFLYYKKPGSSLWYSSTGSREIAPADVHTFVGKEMAEKLLAAPMRPTEPGVGFGGAKEVRALDNLKNVDIGGQGMRTYYGDPKKGEPGIYGNTLENLLRKLDPQWPGRGETRLPDPTQIVESGGRWRVDTKDKTGGRWFTDRAAAERYAAEQHGDPGFHPTPFHFYPLTPKIREEVAKGLPLFSAAMIAALLSQYNGNPGTDTIADILNPPARKD